MVKEDDTINVKFNWIWILVLSIILNIVLFNIIGIKSSITKEKRLDNLEKLGDKYIGLSEFSVGPFRIRDDMTVSELKLLYRTYRDRPQSKEFMYSYIGEVCDGET